MVLQDAADASSYQTWAVSGFSSRVGSIFTIPVSYVSSGGDGLFQFQNGPSSP